MEWEGVWLADLNGFIFIYIYLVVVVVVFTGCCCCYIYIFSNEKQALTIERRGLLKNREKKQQHIKRVRKKSLILIHNYDTASSWAKHYIIRL